MLGSVLDRKTHESYPGSSLPSPYTINIYVIPVSTSFSVPTYPLWINVLLTRTWARQAMLRNKRAGNNEDVPQKA